MLLLAQRVGSFFPVSSFWREGGWIGEDTGVWVNALFFKGVDEYINKVTELLTYYIYL